MSYLNFDKTVLVNLERSLQKEMIRTNRAGEKTTIRRKTLQVVVMYYVTSETYSCSISALTSLAFTV